MPKKIRELKSMSTKAGFVLLPKRGKGSHLWVTHGDTYEEALKNGLEVMEELILIAQDENKPLPGVPQLALT